MDDVEPELLVTFIPVVNYFFGVDGEGVLFPFCYVLIYEGYERFSVRGLKLGRGGGL